MILVDRFMIHDSCWQVYDPWWIFVDRSMIHDSCWQVYDPRFLLTGLWSMMNFCWQVHDPWLLLTGPGSMIVITANQGYRCLCQWSIVHDVCFLRTLSRLSASSSMPWAVVWYPSCFANNALLQVVRAAIFDLLTSQCDRHAQVGR
jgi:hypothetical protein